MYNEWLPVAFSDEVKGLYETNLLGKDILIIRKGEGFVALSNRCPHRLAKLSKGKLVNGEIECPYHGWRFDTEVRLATPSFFDMHVHLENALSLNETGENESGTLEEAVERWAKVRDSLSLEELKNRIKKALILEIFNGITHVRTHADTCSRNLNSVKATLEVKEEMADFVDLQVVAFPEQGVFNCGEESFKRAATMADIIGGKPDGEDNEDLGKSSWNSSLPSQFP